MYLRTMNIDTDVQLRPRRFARNIPGLMVDPLQRAEEETDRLALDLSLEDIAFLKKYAEYRNVMNEVQERKVRQSWSRKSAGEAFMVAQIRQVQAQMKSVFDALGPIPDDPKALREYALKVLELSDKPSKKR